MSKVAQAYVLVVMGIVLIIAGLSIGLTGLALVSVASLLWGVVQVVRKSGD